MHSNEPSPATNKLTGKPGLRKSMVWAMLAAVLAIMLGLVTGHQVSERLDFLAVLSPSNEVFHVDIGDKTFEIPKNFIWSETGWKSGRVNGVNLHVLLPTFEPVTLANRTRFDEPGGRRLLILLEEHSMPPNERLPGHVSMTRQEVFSRRVNGRTLGQEDGPYGLARLKFSLTVISSEEFLIGKKADGGFYWASCSKKDAKPYPRCGTYIEYSPNVYIKYSFPRDNLVNWQEIENRVIDLVAGFESSNQKQKGK